MASDDDIREANAVRVLRGLIVVIVLVGALAIVLERRHTIFIGAILLPSGWVYWRPRWPQLVLWCMWTLPLFMLGAVLHADHPERLGTPSSFLAGSIVILIIVVLPLVRQAYRAPRPTKRSRLPRARVVR